MRVTYYQRHPALGRFSIERVFESVRDGLPPEVIYSIALCRFEGVRPIRLLLNALEAQRRQGDINHVTGDVHYLVNALDPRKTILTIHDCGHLRILRGIKRRIYCKLWFERPIKMCRLVTVISRATASEVCSLFPEAANKIRVVHDPVDNQFRFKPKPFNPTRPVILQVGTRRPNKNVEKVAQALAGIPCKFHIIGTLDAQQRKTIEEFNIDYKNFCNLNPSQIVEMYEQCDMAVFASTYEGFGLPILEAQATGRPVVTSNLAPMTEVAGDGACLVDPYSVESIRSGILSVLDDPAYRASLVGNGLRNVEKFRPSAIAGQYVGLYKEALLGE